MLRITGASGGVGRYLIADLLAAGHQVRAIDQIAPAERLAPIFQGGRPGPWSDVRCGDRM